MHPEYLQYLDPGFSLWYFFGKVLQWFFGSGNRAVRYLPAGRLEVLAVDILV